MSPNKPLPVAPDSISEAVQSVTPQKHRSIDSTRVSSRNSGHAKPKLYEDPSQMVIRAETVSVGSQATTAKVPTRKTSLSDRTRSLTRKLSFFKDRYENDSTNVDGLSTDPSLRRFPVQQSSSPAPNAMSTTADKPLDSDTSQRNHRSDSQHHAHPSEIHAHNSPRTASNPRVEAVTVDPSRGLQQDPLPIPFPPANPTNHSHDLAQDTGDRTTILFVGSHHSRQALSEPWAYPSKTVDTATVHTVRALPLRSYHSSETLQENTFHLAPNQTNANFPANRTPSSQHSPIVIHLPPTEWSSPPSLVSVSPPNASSASPSAIATPPNTRLDSVSATSDDGDTLRAVPIAQVCPQSDRDMGFHPSPQPSTASPADPRPSANTQTAPLPPNTTVTYNGAASSAPLIEFLLSNPAPTPTHRSQALHAHSRGPSGHSTKSATTLLHHRQHSGSDSRRPHIIHPSISHEDIKALGKREDGSHNKMVIRRPSGWKRVFSNGLGGHKKSKSENHQIDQVMGLRAVGIDAPKATGVGKDGVWISRKNFLKT